MLNRFKNAFYGTVNDNESSSDNGEDYNDALFGRRIRNVIKRSTSFQEILTKAHNGDYGDGQNSSHVDRILDQNGRLRLTPATKDDSSIINNNNYNYINNSNSNNNNNSNNYTGSLRRSNKSTNATKAPKFQYTRPSFLQLKTEDEILVSADHQIRPIIVPRDSSKLPWKSGYAECMNAGKSWRNEDQASCYEDVIAVEDLDRKCYQKQNTDENPNKNNQNHVPWYYFGVFDGHAGPAVAVAASMQLHNIIGEKLNQISDLLVQLHSKEQDKFDFSSMFETNNKQLQKYEYSQGEEYSECQMDTFETCTIQQTTSNDSMSNIEYKTTNNEEDSLKTNQSHHDDDDNKHSEIKRLIHDNNNDVRTTATITTEVQESPSETGNTINDTNQTNETTENKNQTSDSNSKCEKILDTVFEGIVDEIEQNVSFDDGVSNKLKELQQQTCNETPKHIHQTKSDAQYKYDNNNDQNDNINLNNRVQLRYDLNMNDISIDKLIVGALESAFWEMDQLIADDKIHYKMAGGCTAIVSLFILGKLYVCNAGDSRAIVCKNNEVIPMSFDFTPISEKERILKLGLQRPEFLGTDFTHLEFLVRPTRKDLGKKMLYKDAYMTGWSMKTITYDDLKIPLVRGEGKRSRVLATMGVTRGFGDHELRAQYGSVLIKPFLTPEPEVRILSLEMEDNLTAEDVLIMGTDGLWDVTSNEQAAKIVKNSFDLFPEKDESRLKYRYTTAAQDLVIHSRGQNTNWNNIWKTNNDKLASLDDIAVFVIPLKQYRDEHIQWKKKELERLKLESLY